MYSLLIVLLIKVTQIFFDAFLGNRAFSVKKNFFFTRCKRAVEDYHSYLTDVDVSTVS